MGGAEGDGWGHKSGAKAGRVGRRGGVGWGRRGGLELEGPGWSMRGGLGHEGQAGA